MAEGKESKPSQAVWKYFITWQQHHESEPRISKSSRESFCCTKMSIETGQDYSCESVKQHQICLIYIIFILLFPVASFCCYLFVLLDECFVQNDHLCIWKFDRLHSLRWMRRTLSQRYIIFKSIFHGSICISETQQGCRTACQDIATVRNLRKHEPLQRSFQISGRALMVDGYKGSRLGDGGGVVDIIGEHETQPYNHRPTHRSFGSCW